ncbi:polyprenyl synthetase family protein [Acidithrix ferrooxidans]|uniref:polyprenyl synthetase family protein n=1 Tax=Acidithrix ferrooxidans TaxID=1280514 RepID=UPI001364B7D2|nr:polyprenyl synthetase family protein [Acidithrix ferrooxidans]
MDRAPAGLRTIAQLVDRRLTKLFDDEKPRWERVDDGLIVPFEALEKMVASGGKRLRPAFCYYGYLGSGGYGDAPILVDLLTSLELLHTFALLHDDIMDGSSTRRGSSTVHERFIEEHRISSYRGESRRFGEGIGILIGDLAFVYADMMMEAAPLATRKIYSELRLEVNIGQYLDLIGTAKGRPTVESAQKVSIYKSGKYTIERPLQIGASLAGASLDQMEELSRFGLPLGEAFQLKDDLLGIFGDSTITGKPVGDDLREGKPTTLVAMTMDRLTGLAKSEFERLFALDLPNESQILAMMEMIEDCGSKAMVEDRVEMLVESSLLALDECYLLDSAKADLRDLAVFIASRAL